MMFHSLNRACCVISNFSFNVLSAAGPENNVLHPEKGITIWDFNYQAFKSSEGIISRKILTERLKIGIL